MILSTNKRTLLIILAAILFLTFSTLYLVTPSSFEIYAEGEYTVVLDAGHGGIDRGVIGVSGKTVESTLNLDLTKRLANQLNALGINVVFTRHNGEGLYGIFSNGFKRRDMERRRDIIKASGANLVISIHMNKYPSSKARGAQVFFNPDIAESLTAAQNLQTAINDGLKGANTRAVQKGDYYILSCTQIPSVIVECGFLSNADDERLLADEQYRERLAYYISNGTAAYLNISVGTDAA